MEVSSHGLDQGRVNGAAFAAALFTNLSRDHLDYHGSMERYGAAKARLFHWPGLQHAVVNLDDAFGAELAASLDRTRMQVLGYGFGKGEIAGHRLDLSQRGLEPGDRHAVGRRRHPQPSARRLQRLESARRAGRAAGRRRRSSRRPCEALAEVEPPAGRLQMIREPGKPARGDRLRAHARRTGEGAGDAACPGAGRRAVVVRIRVRRRSRSRQAPAHGRSRHASGATRRSSPATIRAAKSPRAIIER